MSNRKNKARRAKKAQKVRRRNPIAVAAFMHSGSGRHKDQKKEGNRRACRGSIRA